jgi:hypothetical protein
MMSTIPPKGPLMSLPDAAGPSATPGTCDVPGCTRPIAISLDRCRIHLAEQLSKDEDVIAFGDPELEGIAAVVILTLRSAGIPAMAEERDDASGSIGLDLYTFMQPDREWPLAQIALEVPGAELTDLFGATRLETPMRFGSDVLLRLQVIVPVVDGERIRDGLSRALTAVMTEVVGSADPFLVAVEFEDAR